MPTTPFPPEVRDKLARPNPCTITTLRPDGQPVSVATWYLLDGDRILVNMDRTRRRVEHLRQDPRVALTVLDKDSWYTHISIIGRVVEWRDDEGLSTHYNDQPYPDRDSPRVSAWVEVDTWHGWGAAKR